jgi:hypothetical protein
MSISTTSGRLGPASTVSALPVASPTTQVRSGRSGRWPARTAAGRRPQHPDHGWPPGPGAPRRGGRAAIQLPPGTGPGVRRRWPPPRIPSACGPCPHRGVIILRHGPSAPPHRHRTGAVPDQHATTRRRAGVGQSSCDPERHRSPAAVTGLPLDRQVNLHPPTGSDRRPRSRHARIGPAGHCHALLEHAEQRRSTSALRLVPRSWPRRATLAYVGGR